MKSHRIIFLIMLSMSAASIPAQRPQYQTYGDTIFGHLPKNYFAPWWVYDDWYLTSDTANGQYNCCMQPNMPMLEGISDIFMRQLYTNVPINIVGLAGVRPFVLRSAHGATGTYLVYDERNPTWVPEYFVLYEASPQNPMEFKGKLQWQPGDSCRYLQVPMYSKGDYGYGDQSDCNDHFDSTYIYKLNEYYFDKPIEVRDSFYIGGTFYYKQQPRDNTTMIEDPVYGMLSLLSEHIYPEIEIVGTINDTDYECGLGFNWAGFRYRDSTNIIYWRPDNPRINPYLIKKIQLIFPIFEYLDDSILCPRPAGLSGNTYPDRGMADFFWNTGSCYRSYELGYAPVDADFDSSATIVPFPNNMGVVTGLAQGQDYIAKVRGVCDGYVQPIRSQWSEPIVVSMDTTSNLSDTLWLNDSTYVLGGDTIVISHDGIWDVSDSGNQISVFPNPTTGDVTIDCGGLRVERIELLDLQGRVLLREEPDAASFKLQTSALAPGAYLIRARTAEGVFSRRIVKSE